MATLSRGYSFGSTESVTNTKLHNLVDNASISGIVNADIASGAAIESSKIAFNLSDYVTLAGAQTITGAKTFSATTTFSEPIVDTNLAEITSANKVNGSSLKELNETPSGAGALPIANGGTGQATASAAINALLPTQTNNAGKVLRTNGTSASWGGGGVGEVFTSSGTFVAPTGVKRVFLTMCGGGGGGAGSSNNNQYPGGGGGAGAYLFSMPYAVTPGNSYTVTINSGGGGGGYFTNGTAGGSVVFDTITVLGGAGGTAGEPGSGGAGGVGAVVPTGATISNNGFSGLAGANGIAGTSGGAGGGGFFGRGGAGATSLGAAGSAATGFGSGGGGAHGGGSGASGGAGSPGIVIVAY